MREKLVILLGPTGVGKTELSIDLAKELNGEIISSDSMQIYKYMNIGTDKITKDKMDDIPHHLIDIVNPDEEWTVEDYKNKALKTITDVNDRNSVPIVTGGTGLYINSLVYDLQFAKVPPNETLRNELEELLDIKGVQFLHDKLKAIDEDSANRLHPNDTRRVIRAIEIYKETGKTMTYYNKNFRKPVDRYDLSMIGLNMDRQKLYNRINKRVDIMMDNGLLEEVKSILEMGFKPELTSLEGIGYKELILYLKGHISLEESIELIKQKSRNYAKRQLTWFRRDKRIHWFNKDEFKSYENLKDSVLSIIKTDINCEG